MEVGQEMQLKGIKVTCGTLQEIQIWNSLKSHPHPHVVLWTRIGGVNSVH